MAYTHIDPGREIEISTRLYSSNDQDRVAELVKLPRTELGELEEASVALENAIFSKFSEIEAEWLKQAAETVAIRKAKQYLMVLPVDHTSNQWKKDQYENCELSNMVYKMTYRIYEQTHYDRTKQKTVIDAWYLSWYLHYNTVRNPTPDLTGDGWQIAGQRDKRFTEKADMERYLQGRIKAYAHLFTDISPPIPAEEKRRFCVNGVLLPGYTLEVTMEQAVSDLLALAEDDDLVSLAQEAQPEAAPPEVPKEKPARKSTPVKAYKKKHAPTR